MSEPIYLWPGTAPFTAECGDQDQPSITPFPVEGARGAVVVCPGGAYAMKADHEKWPIAKMFNSQGIAAYVLDYRVSPCTHETPLGDAKRAIRLVRSMGYEKVAIIGFSAGGHLCCSAATHYDLGDPDNEDPIERISSRPDAFIPCYAVVSMLEPYGHMYSREMLMGPDKDNEELARYYSNELQVTKDTPPAFIWHTAEDDCVPVQNSLILAHAMAEKGVSFEMHIYPKGYHGLGLAPEWPHESAWRMDCCNWLLKMGFGV